MGLALACVTLVAAGCGSTPAAPTRVPTTLPDLSTLPALQPAEWSARIAPPSTFSISPDGSAVAGAFVPVGGGTAIPWAFTRSSATIPLDGLGDGAVFALSGQTVVVGPGVADQPGPVTLITPYGRPWTSSAVGPIFATSNRVGSRVAILDNGNASVRLVQVNADGSAQALPLNGLKALGSGASAQFDDSGDVLVADTQQAALFGPTGVANWVVPVHANALPQSFVLDRDGGGVTAATGGNDSTLYQFSAPGGRLGVAWSEPLPAGGDNHLVAGPEGRVAIASAGTLAVYRVQDGALQWQDSLGGPLTGPLPSINALAFGPHDGVVAAVTGCDSSGDACLLVLAPDGSPLGVIALGAGAKVALAANGEAAVVVAAAGNTSQLTWMDLSGLWQPETNASPPSS